MFYLSSSYLSYCGSIFIARLSTKKSEKGSINYDGQLMHITKGTEGTIRKGLVRATVLTT